MSIVKVISSSNAGANLNYLINEKAHNTELTSHRSLGFNGQNIFGDYANKVNARYLADQYWAVRQRAKNPNKKVQVHHLIFSFSQQEFNPTKQNLLQQARQALKLVNDFLHQILPSTAQYLETVQCDSKGKNLHVHVSCNSVLTNGKVLNTNLVSVNSRTVTKNRNQVHYPGIRKQFDDFMTDHFEKLTGRKFHPIEEDNDNLVNAKTVKIDERGGYVWKEDLKQRILDAFNNTNNFADFEAVLEANNGVHVKHRRASIGKDEQGKKIYRDAVTYIFTDENFASHSIRDFAYTKNRAKRGLGLSFTPQAIQHEFEQRQDKSQLIDQEPTKTASGVSQKPNNEMLQQLHQQQLLQQQISQKLLDDESEDNKNGNQTWQSISVQQYQFSNRQQQFDTQAYDKETQQRQSDNQRQQDQKRRQKHEEAERATNKTDQQQRSSLNQRSTKSKLNHQSTNSNQKGHRIDRSKSGQSQPIIKQHKHDLSGPDF